MQDRLSNQIDDNDGLLQKIETQREVITQREQEIEELRDQIERKADEGADLRHVLD